MKTKLLLTLSVFLLSPLLFASANPNVSDISFMEGNMVFKTDTSCQRELSYVSEDKTITVDLNNPSFRQSHKIQLWNLDFTTFDYNLKLTDSEGNVTLKEGSFTVVPVDPTLIKKTEDTQKSLNEMTREELISLLDKLLKK
jgi:hypothetical protein